MNLWRVVKMKNIIVCALFIILFSCPATVEASPAYAEGEVLVTITAPAFEDYNDMNAYSQAILQQAEAFAKKYELKVFGTYPETARSQGKSIIALRSDYKSTEEIMKELSSDPDVISMSPNYIEEIPEPNPEPIGCNSGYGIILLLAGFVLSAINRKK
jgi:hypothetical protein